LRYWINSLSPASCIIALIFTTLEIKADEARYYTKARQEAEREATKAHKRGGLLAFDTVDELMDYIEAK